MPQKYETFHGGMKYSGKGLKYSTEVSNIPRTYEIFHGGVKCSTEKVKYASILDGGVKYSTAV